MAINFPDPATQTPVNTFSPTSSPLATTNGFTYTYDGSKWVSAGVNPNWDRTGTTVSPATAGDSVDLGTGSMSADDAILTDRLDARGGISTDGGSSISTGFYYRSDAGTDGLQLYSGGSSSGFRTVNIQSSGYATFGAGAVTLDSDGVKFNGDTSADNALDDYETGTWTPTSKQGTLSGSSVGAYTKIGNLCTINAYVVGFSDITHADAVEIQGLPFSMASSDAAIGPVMIRNVNNQNGSNALTAPVGYLADADTSLRVYQQTAQGDLNYDSLKYEDLHSSSTTSIRFTLTYITA